MFVWCRLNPASLASMLVLASLVGPGSLAVAQTDIEAIRDRLVGVYALIEYGPHGDEPTGRIWYAPGGQMSAMLFQPGREPVANDAPAARGLV